MSIIQEKTKDVNTQCCEEITNFYQEFGEEFKKLMEKLDKIQKFEMEIIKSLREELEYCKEIIELNDLNLDGDLDTPVSNHVDEHENRECHIAWIGGF